MDLIFRIGHERSLTQTPVGPLYTTRSFEQVLLVSFL